MPRITEMLVNGERRACEADAGRSLLSVLRISSDTWYPIGKAQRKESEPV